MVQLSERTGIVDREVLLDEYGKHSGSVTASLESYRERKKDADEYFDLYIQRPRADCSSGSRHSKEHYRPDAEFLEAVSEEIERRAGIASATNDARPAAPPGPNHRTRPLVFDRSIYKKGRQEMDANFGIRLREFILPIFKDPADCYMALMLWYVVGDTIPLESEISARFRDDLNDPDFIYDLYGDESSSCIPCCFDTRAEYIQAGRGACVYFDKLHL